MLRRFIKQSKVLIVVVLCFISNNYCFGEFSTEPTQLPAIQFQSTSTMKTSYEVPALNQYGVANVPYQGTYSPRPRRNENGLPGTEGQEPTGGLAPVGDIDILTILIMLGLWFIFKKHS